MTLFADTSFLIAVANPADEWSELAVQLQRSRRRELLVTTEAVLSEFLAFMSRGGPTVRTTAVATVRRLMASPAVDVLPASTPTFEEALDLYEARPDKGYSLVDCMSMNAMRRLAIDEILSSDHHFEQEGFTILLRR